MDINSKFKVLIITDSLSLPRPHEGGAIKYEETYVSFLKRANPEMEFIHVGIGAATLPMLNKLCTYYAYAEPLLVILQCGIVDCAPRALSEFELVLFKKLHLLPLILPFTKFLRKHRKLTYTKPSRFKEALIEIKNKFDGIPVVGIGIIPACAEYEAIVPGISKNIEIYNAILAENLEFISNDDFPKDGIINDYHHLSAQGHALIFSKLQKVIASKFQSIKHK